MSNTTCKGHESKAITSGSTPNKKAAKTTIANSILKLKTIYDNRPNAFLLRVFMDSKADEIVDIFSDGPYFDVFKLKEDLLKMSPLNASKWNSIK